VAALPAAPEGALALVVSGVEVYLPLAGLVDADAERARMEKELAEAESHIVRLKALLSSDFAGKAPAALVDKERAKLAAFEETAAKIKAQM
jgi:valyl-tRNA synthetase